MKMTLKIRYLNNVLTDKGFFLYVAVTRLVYGYLSEGKVRIASTLWDVSLLIFSVTGISLAIISTKT